MTDATTPADALVAVTQADHDLMRQLHRLERMRPGATDPHQDALQLLARHRLSALADQRSEPMVPADALPAQIGRVSLGERRSDGDRLCSHGHPVPAGHPLYWPERMGEHPDDIDPLCLAHAIDQAESDQWCGDACPAADQRSERGGEGLREALEALKPLASADIDVSGTAAIGITSADIIRAQDVLSAPAAPECRVPDGWDEALKAVEQVRDGWKSNPHYAAVAEQCANAIRRARHTALLAARPLSGEDRT